MIIELGKVTEETMKAPGGPEQNTGKVQLG